MAHTPVARQPLRSSSPAHLESGTVLEWKGPSLVSTILPDLSSLPELRRRNTLHQDLVHHAEQPTGSPRSSIWIDLVENLRRDGGRHLSQVWACRARGLGHERGHKVVLKLYVDSLRPRVEPDPMGLVKPEQVEKNNGWYPSSELIKSEVTAYKTLRRLEGNEIPYCYGLYTFKLSNGEVCRGFVLEDLSDRTHSIETLLEHHKNSSTPLDLGQFKALMAATMEVQESLLDHSISVVHRSLSDLLVVETPSTGSLSVVTLGFGHAQHRGLVEAELAETNKRNRAKGKPLKSWDDSAKDALVALFATELGDSKVRKEWKATHEASKQHHNGGVSIV
ncbi:hypothetical protein JCM11491_003096 [Sporobolomyces phaffii]